MAKRTRPKQLAAFLDNYRAATLLILAALFSVSTIGQTVPQVNNVPWYEFTKKLSVGKFMLKQSGEYDTSFTIPAITASVVLDTISEDKTVTFADGTVYDKGVVVYLHNVNSSAFVWNVVGNVKESETGDAIETIARGLHIFYWTGQYWSRLKTGGGSTPATDTNTVIYPITMVNRAIGIDPDGLPTDTCFVAAHNDSLFNVCYYYTGVRDSTFIDMLGEGGGGGVDTIYVEQQGLTGDSILWAKNDSTLAAVRIRDSTGIETGYAPDGALYIKATGGTAWSLDGNTVTSEKTIGTNDNFDVPIETNGTVRARFGTSGQFRVMSAFSGAATGMTWYPDSASFRIGASTTGTHLQNLGYASFGGGIDPTSGSISAITDSATFAFGIRPTATGRAAIAMGETVSATGNNSFAGGINVTASGTAGTFVFGNNLNSGSSASIAMFGSNNTLSSSSTGHFITGISNTAGGGGGAVTHGSFNTSTATGAMTGGNLSTSRALYSILYGMNLRNKAIDTGSLGIGKYADSTLGSMLFNVAWGYGSAAANIKRNIFRLDTAGNMHIRAASEVITADATPTTIIDIPTISNTVEFFTLTIAGVDASDRAVMYERKVKVQNVAGTVSIRGAVETVGTDYEDAALSGCDVSITVSGTNIRVTGTGIAANSMRWSLSLTKKSHYKNQ